jgi:Fe-S cluster biogenesis protein NfuA/nitrite reductase/ring-hydroxylating ferredoxin subunit
VEFDQAVAELDTLIGTLEREEDERALLLLQLIDAIHRPALELILAGELDHPVAGAVLAMYDLAPLDERLQVEEALDEVRPYIESHGGGLELIDVEDGVVHVRMSGSCNGCAASSITLRRGVEEKLRERVEGFKEVVAHEPEGEEAADQQNGAGGPTLLQIEDLRKPVFVDAGSLADLEPGELKAVEVDGKSILIVNVEGEPYAFRNVCPTDGRSPLDGGRLAGTVIVCPWHNCAYDARSGKRADDEPGAADLAVVPVAVRDGALQVAVNVA